jgi:hypothetical protein
MVATTRIWFLVWADYRVDFFLKKNPLAGETGVRGFSKAGEGYFFLIKSPHELSFSSDYLERTKA